MSKNNLNFDIKKLEKAKGEMAEKKLEEIKELCTSLKNSGMSKNDCLRAIKNVCLRKEDTEKMWKSILGEDFNMNGGM